MPAGESGIDAIDTGERRFERLGSQVERTLRLQPEPRWRLAAGGLDLFALAHQFVRPAGVPTLPVPPITRIFLGHITPFVLL